MALKELQANSWRIGLSSTVSLLLNTSLEGREAAEEGFSLCTLLIGFLEASVLPLYKQDVGPGKPLV